MADTITLLYIDYTGEALRDLLGITRVTLSNRVKKGWLPKGWRYRKVSGRHVFTVMLLQDQPYYYDSEDRLAPLPSGHTHYAKKKEFVSHNGRRRQGKK